MKPAGRALLYSAGGGIGDSLVASVVGRALLERYAAVDVLTLPAHRATLERVPHYRDVLLDDGNVSTMAARIAQRGYDAAVVTWATAHTASVVHAAQIPIRVGQSRRLYSGKFTHQVPVRSESGDVTSHWSDVLLDYARALGCDTANHIPEFVPTDDDRREAEALLADLDVREPFFMVHPTCAASARRGFWPADGWVALVRAIRERFNAVVAISGAPSDVPLVAPIAQAAGATLVAGKTGIGAFAALARRARAFAVMHSGPMHVAAAVGTPTVGIFPLQADFPDRWAPKGPRVEVVRASYPCRTGERIETCPDYACVAHLDTPRVLAAIEAVVSKP